MKELVEVEKCRSRVWCVPTHELRFATFATFRNSMMKFARDIECVAVVTTHREREPLLQMVPTVRIIVADYYLPYIAGTKGVEKILDAFSYRRRCKESLLTKGTQRIFGMHTKCFTLENMQSIVKKIEDEVLKDSVASYQKAHSKLVWELLHDVFVSTKKYAVLTRKRFFQSYRRSI